MKKIFSDPLVRISFLMFLGLSGWLVYSELINQPPALLASEFTSKNVGANDVRLAEVTVLKGKALAVAPEQGEPYTLVPLANKVGSSVAAPVYLRTQNIDAAVAGQRFHVDTSANKAERRALKQVGVRATDKVYLLRPSTFMSRRTLHEIIIAVIAFGFVVILFVAFLQRLLLGNDDEPVLEYVTSAVRNIHPVLGTPLLAAPFAIVIILLKWFSRRILGRTPKAVSATETAVTAERELGALGKVQKTYNDLPLIMRMAFVVIIPVVGYQVYERYVVEKETVAVTALSGQSMDEVRVLGGYRQDSRAIEVLSKAEQVEGYLVPIVPAEEGENKNYPAKVFYRVESLTSDQPMASFVVNAQTLRHSGADKQVRQRFGRSGLTLLTDPEMTMQDKISLIIGAVWLAAGVLLILLSVFKRRKD